MRRGGLLVAGIAVSALLAPAAAEARTFEVTRTGDTIPNGCNAAGCTLREAVIAANNRPGADVVELKRRRTYTLARPGVDEDAGLTGDLDSTGPLTLRVAGRRGKAVIDGGGLDRILHAFARTRVVGLVIRDGNMSGTSESGDGGGIFARANLTLIRSTVTGNAASDNGEGVSADYGASITLIRSAVTGNLGQGVREEDSGRIVARRSRITGNDEVGIQESGGGNVVLERSHVSGNGDEGARELDGGNLVVSRSRLSSNATDGAFEDGDGALRVSRSQAKANANNGFIEFGEGSLLAKRARAVGNQNNGFIEFDGGSLRATRARAVGNVNNGFAEFDDGDLAIKRSLADRNNNNNVTEFGAGSLRATRTTSKRTALNFGFAEFSDGSASLVRSKSLGNANAGLYNDGAGGAVLRASTISGNVNGFDGGGIAHNGSGSLRVVGSTIDRNSTLGAGGGIYSAAPITVANSTLSGNRAAESGGGIRLDGAAGVGRLNAVTVVRNVINFTNTSVNHAGGGISSNNGAVFASVRNSLIALNRADFGAQFPDCNAAITSSGRNLVGNFDGCTWGSTDLERSNPRVGRLRDNGGPTRTVALKRRSPAIGKAGNDAPNRDQRGRKRDRRPDIGAFER